MTHKYLAFDLEITKPIPDDTYDWKDVRPLGISCIATYTGDEADSHLWFASRAGIVQSHMDERELVLFVDYLHGKVSEGYTILGHNICAFDMAVLAEESGLHDECADLALHSIDSCFQLYAMLGYPIGLDAICQGMKLPGKPEGMDGAKAPLLWANGLYDKVLSYVQQDVRCTLNMAQTVERKGYLEWITKRGQRRHLGMPYGWLSVEQCMQLPEVDQSWMDNPIPRSKFVGWMEREAAACKSP